MILDFVTSTPELLVVTHFYPDGDAVGSLVAFGAMMEQLGLSPILAVDGKCPDKYSFLPGFSGIRDLQDNPPDRPFSKVVILDAGSRSRIGEAEKYIAVDADILNIDHHFTGKFHGLINHIDVDASATAELLYDLCRAWELDLTPRIAYGIYTGIFTDTGRFRFSNTSARAMQICSELISKGVNPCLVTDRVYYSVQPVVMNSLAWALAQIELVRNGTIAMIHLDLEHASPDTEGFIEFASSLRGVAISIFICEFEKNVYKVSIRSKCKIDVSQLAKRLGGGGHRKAAGFRFSGSDQDLRSLLITEVGLLLDSHYAGPDDLKRDLSDFWDSDRVEILAQQSLLT